LHDFSFVQSPNPTLTFPLLVQPDYSHFTYLNIDNLKEGNIILKNENSLLKSQ
ncbi:28006_t:CDS:1, partial [Gigaspora margarita]